MHNISQEKNISHDNTINNDNYSYDRSKAKGSFTLIDWEYY